MVEKYGAQYLAYSDRVPRFFPRAGQWRRLLSAGARSRHVEP